MSAVMESSAEAIAGTTADRSPVLGLLSWWLLAVFVNVTDRTPSRFSSSMVSFPFLRLDSTDLPLRLTAVTRYPCRGDRVTVKGWCRLTATVPVLESLFSPTATVPFPVISTRRDTSSGTLLDNTVVKANARTGIQHNSTQRRDNTVRSF